MVGSAAVIQLGAIFASPRVTTSRFVRPMTDEDQRRTDEDQPRIELEHRGDVWVLPFLNLYGLAGETAGVTRPAVVFPNG